jgi:DNA end-binding protein Ku
MHGHRYIFVTTVATRSIATLSLSFGLVSIPVKVYSATESSSAIRFKLMAASGARVRQQYVTASAPAARDEPRTDATAAPEPVPEPRRFTAASRSAASSVVDFPAPRLETAARRDAPPAPDEPAVIDRSEMVKGYEFEKGKFVVFSADELKALEAGSRQTIDIVAFIPEHSVEPIYYDKAYFLAPDKRGAKPYHLLLRAMRDTGRSALAKWAFRSKEYVVEIRPAEGGMVLQQLLYADEVRLPADLDIDEVAVGDAELKLARQLIEQIARDTYDPAEFVDEEKQRILAAVEAKIAGRQIVAPPEPGQRSPGAQVVDLVEALRASLQSRAASPASAGKSRSSTPSLGERKPVKRATAGPADAAPARKSPSRKR